MPNPPLRLKLSRVQKKELLSFMKSTRDKEEYRRAYAIKQKMEGYHTGRYLGIWVSITVMCMTGLITTGNLVWRA